MPKTDVKGGVASRVGANKVFCIREVFGVRGSLPVPHRIIGKIWKA